MSEDVLLGIALASALAALLMHFRRDRRDHEQQRERAAPRRPAVVASEAGVKSTKAPKELVAAWVQFVRDDVARAVNSLNNRLNAIGSIAANVNRHMLAGSQLRDLEQIRTEIGRATNITSGLLNRVQGIAPTTLPPEYQRLYDLDVPDAHILVVDDDESNRTVICKLLRHFGHDVTGVSNGLEALDVLESTYVDCVISDLQMPALSGRNLFEQVEEFMPHMASRFVFVTGDHTRPESREFLERSGQPIIVKPYEAEALMGAVADTLVAVAQATGDRRPRSRRGSA